MTPIRPVLADRCPMCKAAAGRACSPWCTALREQPEPDPLVRDQVPLWDTDSGCDR